MTSAFPPSPDCWKTLYTAAILETNKRLLSRRVSEAEEAVRVRGREMFYGYGTSEEKEELEDALYALRALRTASQHTEAARESVHDLNPDPLQTALQAVGPATAKQRRRKEHAIRIGRLGRPWI